MTILQLAGIATFALGVGLTLWGFILLKRKKAFLSNAVKVTGTVIGFRKGGSSPFVSSADDDDMLFREEENIFKGEMVAPQIQYTVESGEKYVIEGMSSSPPKYKIGDQVPLLYLMNKPDEAVVDSFLEKWLGVTMLFGFGIVLILIGLLFLMLEV